MRQKKPSPTLYTEAPCFTVDTAYLSPLLILYWIIVQSFLEWHQSLSLYVTGYTTGRVLSTETNIWKDGEEHGIFSILFYYVVLQVWQLNFITNLAIKVSNICSIFAVSQHSANIFHNQCGGARVLLEKTVLYKQLRSTLKQGGLASNKLSGAECKGAPDHLQDYLSSSFTETATPLKDQQLEFRVWNIKARTRKNNSTLNKLDHDFQDFQKRSYDWNIISTSTHGVKP